MAPLNRKKKRGFTAHLDRYVVSISGKKQRPNEETGIERAMRLGLDFYKDQGILEYEDQAHVGRYRPDFVLKLLARPAVKIIIECDGPIHTTLRQQVQDRKKDSYYKSQQYHVYRFTHEVIMKFGARVCISKVLHLEGIRPLTHHLEDLP